MEDGSFLGWTLTSNSLDKVSGHNAPISELISYMTFILSADVQGNIQIRDLAQQFNQIIPQVTLTDPTNP